MLRVSKGEGRKKLFLGKLHSNILVRKSKEKSPSFVAKKRHDRGSDPIVIRRASI